MCVYRVAPWNAPTMRMRSPLLIAVHNSYLHSHTLCEQKLFFSLRSSAAVASVLFRFEAIGNISCANVSFNESTSAKGIHFFLSNFACRFLFLFACLAFALPNHHARDHFRFFHLFESQFIYYFFLPFYCSLCRISQFRRFFPIPFTSIQ